MKALSRCIYKRTGGEEGRERERGQPGLKREGWSLDEDQYFNVIHVFSAPLISLRDYEFILTFPLWAPLSGTLSTLYHRPLITLKEKNNIKFGAQ